MIPAEVVEDHAPFMPGPDSAADMLRKVTNFQKKSVRSYFAIGEYQGMDTDRVRVGTIHSAKGREADHVLVGTDLTEKVVEQMVATVDDPEDVPGCEEFTKTTSPVPVLTDNERRVFYVACPGLANDSSCSRTSSTAHRRCRSTSCSGTS